MSPKCSESSYSSCQAVVWGSPSMATTAVPGVMVRVRSPVPGSSSSLRAASGPACQKVIGGVDQPAPSSPLTPSAMYSAYEPTFFPFCVDFSARCTSDRSSAWRRTAPEAALSVFVSSSRRGFNKTTEDPKVRASAVVNDETNFGKVFDRAFADNMADHIETTAGIGRQYFGP
ncbi:hypothetical protein, partial [Kitasatospora cinereorecta]